MTIGTLAKVVGTHVETISYYQRCGLVTVPEKRYGGIRRYDESALARLHFIRSAQWPGFSLDEISELVVLEEEAIPYHGRSPSRNSKGHECSLLFRKSGSPA
ncbi:MAG: hypothetical protein CMG91_12810 [Marinobacter sp.]|nr:hypothetical protein [Marinobacter sp.]